MNNSARIRLVAPVLLGAALLAAPSSARAATPAHRVAAAPVEQVAGVYRLSLASGGQTTRMVHLMLQKSGDRYSGMLLSDANDVLLSDLRFEGETLTAVTQTNAGKGILRLDMGVNGVSGTLTIGKQIFTVTGERAG